MRLGILNVKEDKMFRVHGIQGRIELGIQSRGSEPNDSHPRMHVADWDIWTDEVVDCLSRRSRRDKAVSYLSVAHPWPQNSGRVE